MQDISENLCGVVGILHMLVKTSLHGFKDFQIALYTRILLLEMGY